MSIDLDSDLITNKSWFSHAQQSKVQFDEK